MMYLWAWHSFLHYAPRGRLSVMTITGMRHELKIFKSAQGAVELARVLALLPHAAPDASCSRAIVDNRV